MNKQVIKDHFKKQDSVIYKLIEDIGLTEIKPSDNYFHNLCRSICGQQLSTKVARVIFDRFRTLLPDQIVSPDEILKLKDEDIRAIGMSYSKIAYIKDLSLKVVDGTVDFTKINSWTNEEVIEHLTQVKGIGIWTCEMFMMFTLGRADVFSPGDLGLRRAIQKLYGFKELPTVEQMEKITKKWRPYRTYVCRLLWDSLDNSPA